MKNIALLLLVLAGFASNLCAEEAGATRLRVLVKPAEPFTFEKDGQIVGYSVDLWKRVAEEAGLPYEIKMVKTLPEVLDALQKGEADVGVGAISITEQREKVLDFSHSFFESGLQILTRGQGSGSAAAAFGALFKGGLLKVVGVILLALLVVSNILWLVERKHNEETFPRDYKRGLWEAAWWAISTIISGGCENKATVSVPGRLVAIAWMLGGIGLTSYITATLASAMTVHNLASDVHGIADLKGQVVSTVSGSTSESFLKDQGFNPSGFVDLNTAIDALSRGKVKAVVYDGPMLRYYLTKHADSPLQIAGDLFERQGYGFAMPLRSPHRKEINEALLKLQRDGFTAGLDKKWFAGATGD